MILTIRDYRTDDSQNPWHCQRKKRSQICTFIEDKEILEAILLPTDRYRVRDLKTEPAI